MNGHTPSTEAGSDGAARDRLWRFGDCRLDGRTLELTVGGNLVKLEPKPLELLLHLLRHPGEVVTKDELQDAVWPGRILSESVLTKAVAKLRHALGDDDQTLIRTVHGYGYRLVAPVSVEAAVAPVVLPQLGFRPGDALPHRPHWRLLQTLGSGGYGEAWLAEHDKTRERRVFKFAFGEQGLTALKREVTLYRVLKDTYGERRDWVRVLDWNVEEAPYFIETRHAAGGDLPAWVASQGGLAAIPLAQRLEWVAQAADALSAAHAAGVLHKDLKPSNLLVDFDAGGAPFIQLADFGSGRLLDPASLQITRLGFTRTETPGDGSDSGTPLYVAPERIAGQLPTAQSDIYALGILLFQLVVGDFKRPLSPGWEADIEDELLREDVHAAAVGDPALRMRDGAELAQRLRGLEARRAARASERTAAREADRLRAALERARARRRWAWAFTALFAVAAGVSLAMLLQLRQANRNTETERQVATAVNEFLVTDLIGAADPLTTGRSEVSIREVLDRGAQSAAARFAGQPLSESAVRLALGRAYLGVGEYQLALDQYDLAQARGAGAGTAGEALALSAREDAVIALSYLDDWAAVRERATALALAPDRGVALHARQFLARALLHEGDMEGAAAAFEALVPEFEAHFGTPSARVARLYDQYALALREKGDLEGAIRRSEAAVAASVAVYGEDHFSTFDVSQTLGGTLYLAGRLDEAVALMQPAVARAERVLGADHYRTLVMKIDLGSALQAKGDLLGAERLFLQSLEGLQRQFGEDHKDVRTLLNNLGLLSEDLGRPDDEIRYLERSWKAELRVAGERNPSAFTATNNYARALGRSGRWQEAEAIQSRNVALAQEVLPADHWQLAVMRYNWAHQLGNLGRREQAMALFAQSIDTLTAQVGADHPVTLKAVSLRDALVATAPAG